MDPPIPHLTYPVLHKRNMKVLLTIATEYHLPFQNFIRVTSSSASSSVCTLSCLGVMVMRYGSGLREDSPLYPSIDMGSSGRDRISNAQSNREMARHSSLSATWMAGQMRRLQRIRTISQWEERRKRFVLTRRRTPNGPDPLRWRGCLTQRSSMYRLRSVQV